MKLSNGILILAVAILGFASCSKDDVAGKNGLAGTWVGVWGFDQDTPTHYERWEIKKNGDMTVYDGDGDVIAKGHCSADGVNFKAEYKSEFSDNEYSFACLYHDVLKEIVGTWGLSPSSSNRGTIEMYKQ